jgi:pimeloyl-ACP methyl ester carboxylesterase
MELAEPAGLLHHHCRVSTGITLHMVERPGHGRPILLLHGIWGMWRTWISLLEEPPPALARRPIYAVDFRGHGFSDHPESGYTLADYAADIIALADQLATEQFTLVGHSLGALVALEIAATVPERIDKLVLEEPPLPIPEEGEEIEGFWQEFVEALIGFYFLKHESHEVIVEELLNAADWMTRELAETGAFFVSHTADGVFTAVMRQEVTIDTFAQLEQPLPMPALIFQGTLLEQRALADRGVEMLRRILLHPKEVALLETGHIVHSSAPCAFNDEVAAFLDC